MNAKSKIEQIKLGFMEKVGFGKVDLWKIIFLNVKLKLFCCVALNWIFDNCFSMCFIFHVLCNKKVANTYRLTRQVFPTETSPTTIIFDNLSLKNHLKFCKCRQVYVIKI